jgi:hypothetical protein
MKAIDDLKIEIGKSATRFSLGTALHYWLSHNHEGQFSAKYEAMCGIDYTPSPLEPELTTEHEKEWIDRDTVAYLLYHTITDENWQNYLQEFNEMQFSE